MSVLALRVKFGTWYLGALTRAAVMIRSVIPRDSRFGQLLLSIKRKAQPIPVLKQSYLLNAFAKRRPNVRFVQIGANDGVLDDPLREFVLRYGWTGVLVEPLKHTFERLKHNYRSQPGLIFANVAITAQEGFKDLYYVAEDPEANRTLPVWYRGLGSLSREVVLKHAAEHPAIGEKLTAERVECITFKTLCERHEIRDFDLMSIDAEGHDFEILQLIDFAAYRPAILLYEHHHMESAQKAACQARLARYGYEFHEEVLNTICFNPAALRPEERDLLPLWREIRLMMGWIPM